MGLDRAIIEWIFNTTMASVWKAWTDPAVMKTWFGSESDGAIP
jgi:uncharacterized protein YndB with AHSA1/START domain